MKAIAIACVLFVTTVAAFAQSLPSYFPLPAGAEAANVEAADYGEAEFVVPNSDAPAARQGKSWHADIKLANINADADHSQIWAAMRPALIKAGWTPLFEKDLNPYTATLRYQKNGKDAWAGVEIYGADDVRVSIVEAAKLNTTFALNLPAVKPENVSADSGDFPYLAPLPGSKRTSSAHDDAPMVVQLPGESDPQTVAVGGIVKSYEAPAGMSNLAFATLYAQALTQAGWNVVEKSQGMHQTDVVLTAHYAKQGRNLWSSLHYGGGEYTIRVADAGAPQIAADLAKKCHVPVYGVLFDFDKATLRADSDAPLRAIQQILAADQSLRITIEGHTDNVGTAAHNQKLSEQRAASVVSWLVAHGIAVNRLTAAGYGSTRPIAANDDDAGRAKNRRVELRKQGCSG